MQDAPPPGTLTREQIANHPACSRFKKRNVFMTIEELEYGGKIYPVWYRHEKDYRRRRKNGRLVARGRTVAFFQPDEKHVMEAFAECSIKDCFSKKMGRVIAAGRLLKAAEDIEYLKKKMYDCSPSQVVFREVTPDEKANPKVDN